MMCNISCSAITKNVKFLRIFHGRKGNHLPEESLLSSPWICLQLSAEMVTCAHG